MKFLVKYLFYIALFFAISLAPEIIGERFKTWIESFIPNYERVGLVIFLILIAIQVWLDLKSKSETEQKNNPNPPLLDPEYLKKRYVRRLDDKMAGRLPINFRKIDFTETATQISNKQFQSISPEVVSGEVVSLFKAAKGRLLVVGDAGVGKSTFLLELAIGLCEIGELPIVISLSTWSSSFDSVETWLEKVLPVEYELNGSKNYLSKLLDDSTTVILFDGLDEIFTTKRRKEDISKCLLAIDNFGGKRQRRYVIASSKDAYLGAAKDAHVQFCIEIGSLEFGQIKTELEKRGKSQPEDIALLSALENDLVLKKAVEVPFYFNCLQLLFGENRQLSFLPIKPEQLEKNGFSTEKVFEGLVNIRQAEILNLLIRNEVLKCKNSVESAMWLYYFSQGLDGLSLLKKYSKIYLKPVDAYIANSMVSLVLRLLQGDKLPKDLPKFLDEMSNYQISDRKYTTAPVHLLFRDGAGWSFRHQLIKEFFQNPKRWLVDSKKKNDSLQ